MNVRTAILSLLPVSSVLLAGCLAGEAQEAPQAPPAPEVTTATVAVRELSDWADFTGRLEAVENVELKPRVAGYVESVHFVEGGRVAQGDLLFKIDARPFEAEVARLEAEKARAEAELKLAQRYSDRAQRLLKEKAASVEEAEQLESNAAVARATVEAVEAALDVAKLNLSFTRITAPIAGRVSRANVTPGNLVDSSTLLTTLVADDRVYAYFDVDEQTYLEHVQGGDVAGTGDAEVWVGLVDEHGYPHSAHLDFVDNRVDPKHGTIRARAVLDNRDGRFTPGLFVRLKLVSPRRYYAALVDDRAIGTDLGRKFVFVVNDANVVEYRPVTTGRAIEGLRVVTDGLATGDVVIVNGVQRVRPGMPVNATEVAMGDERVSSPLLAAIAPPRESVAVGVAVGVSVDVSGTPAARNLR